MIDDLRKFILALNMNSNLPSTQVATIFHGKTSLKLYGMNLGIQTLNLEGVLYQGYLLDTLAAMLFWGELDIFGHLVLVLR